MTSRLYRIEIHNFKAFRSFELDLEGRHLLVYGPNGAGKSSLYWALYTFLQSAHKPTPQVTKYFDPAGDERLLNLHEQRQATPRPGQIALTFRDQTGAETRDVIGLTDHSTRLKPVIEKGDLASDFVTYRYLFRFSNFRNSALLDVWPLFEKEILPFCVSTSSVRPADLWARISDGTPNPHGYRGTAGGNAYDRFADRCQEFATVLDEVVDSISSEAQVFYDKHFAVDDPEPVRLQLRVTRPPSYTTRTLHGTFVLPEIGFGIQVGGDQIERPQAFLNEAKLTQLALSIRFAASLVNLHESAVKLLVLDDLLISLDMSNRMRVVEILLSETFDDYQKVFMTHDLGFFQECERRIGARHTDWKYISLQGLPSDDEITVKIEKNELQKAEGYIRGHDYDEAALALRKASETIVKRYLDDEVLPTKKFSTLDGMLREAKAKLNQELPLNLYTDVLKDIPVTHRSLVIAPGTSDIDGNPILSGLEKSAIRQARDRLRSFCSGDVVTRLQMLHLIDGLLATKDRVLNSAAHAGLHPIYEWEVREAFDLIKQLGETLEPPPSL